MNDAQRLKIIEASLMLNLEVAVAVSRGITNGNTTFEVACARFGKLLCSKDEAEQIVAKLMVSGLYPDVAEYEARRAEKERAHSQQMQNEIARVAAMFEMAREKEREEIAQSKWSRFIPWDP